MLAWIFGIALSIGSVNAASSDCLNLKFNNWDSVCLGITKNSTKSFKLSVDKSNLSNGSSIRCYVILPNASMYSLNNCAWTFSYGWVETDDVIISATYVLRNGDFYSTRTSEKINFSKGTWGSSSSSSSSSNSDEVELSTNRKSPSTNQYVNLTIKTDKKYTGKLNLSAKYRSSSSSSWSSISNTSSTYFSSYSDEWDDGYYKMKSSDKGEVTLSNIVKFKKSGYYRIYVKDTDGNESYIQFNVDTSSSSSSNDDLEVKASPSSPDTYEWVKLTISTDRDYTGKIKFSKLQYKSSSSSSWSTISNTSSTYVSDYSSEWSNEYYKMTSSDKGEVTLKNLVKFKKSGYYRIYVEDTDGNESYVQINVDTSSSSSSSNEDLEVKASPSSPDTYEWVKLTITTDDDYTGKINFSKFQYKSSSSSSWSTISSRTSSTYVSDYSSDWSNGYYRMTSSDDGEAILKNLVKFKKSWYYRIYVEDTDDNESYVQINVDTSSSSSSSSDEIELSTNRKSPSTSQYVNLTIETDDSKYTGKLNLSAKYRSSSSSSWSSISNTSSTYFNDYSDEWDDGYYKMKSSDKGEVTLSNLVKFRKNGYYRIYVKDTDGNESYIQFNVWNVDDDDDSRSSVDGFTTSELNKVKSTYKEWNDMIWEMERKYPKLKRDTYWVRLSNNFYDDMKDVINNKKSRDFEDYDDFKDAFDDWYNYTIRNI